MTNVTELIMVDPIEEEDTGGRGVLWMMVAGIGIVMTAGAIAGYLAEHQAQGGGPLGTSGIITMAVFAAIIAGLSFFIWRSGKAIHGSTAKLLRREKLNQRITVACALLGGAIAIALMVASPTADGAPDVLSDGAIAPWMAVLLSIIIGIGLPILSYYWHKRVIDEQEEAAYRAGALIAIYAFWYIAPVWWLLWRGGMLPAPNGVALYLMTTFVALVGWFWKKYR